MKGPLKKNYSNFFCAMKRFLIAAALLGLFSACHRESNTILTDNVNGIVAPEITALTETDYPGNTRTILEVDGEGVGTIYWKPGDEINIFYGTTGTHYTSQNAVNATTAVFSTSDVIGSTESASENIWGLYPYNSSATCTGSAVNTTLPSTQYGVPGTFDDDLFITLAHNTSTVLKFYNVCGGIKFSLSRDDITTVTFRGNNNEDIAGDISLAFSESLPTVSVTSGEKEITLTPKAGGTFASGEYYYIVLNPVTLSSGFTMTFDTDTQIGTFEYTAKAITLKRAVFSKKDNIDSYATFNSKPVLTNLSSGGTANCYIVSAAGDYKFNATVKGNSEESVGTPVSAEVLWESFGTSVVPSIGDLVYSVSLLDGYVYFSATGAKGNALIAVKDSEDTVLWSWHIWLVNGIEDETYEEDDGNHYPAVGVLPSMMDRNLGATSKEVGSLGSYGLLYQWGRKDPFPGSSVLYSEQQGAISARVSTSIGQEWRSNISETVSDYARKNPTCFIRVDTYSNTDDWGGATSTSWNISKTINDPCPIGYKMPAGCGPSGGVADPPPVWYYSCFHTHARYDSVNHGWLMPTSNGDESWYPLSGLIPSSGFQGATVEGNWLYIKGCYYPGNVGKYWSCINSAYWGGSYGIQGLYLTDSVSYENDSTWGLKNKCAGASVRCQKE